MKPSYISIITATVLGMLIPARFAAAEVIVAEDFLYSQPTKVLGAGGGFALQDYGGGQNGPAGQWLGRWVSVGDAVITGTDITEEQGYNPETDTDQGFTRNFLSAQFLQRPYQTLGLPNDQTVYFGVKMRNSVPDTALAARMMISDPSGENEIAIGFSEGGFLGRLGDLDDFFQGPGITDDGSFHALVGKLEVNALGSSERLTVWLDPTDVETAEETVQVEADVISGLSDLTGLLRLGQDVGGGSEGIFWDDVAVGTTWDDVIALDVPRATLLVDTTSREMRIANSSGTDLDVNFYQIESVGESLFANRWESLTDQGVEGWRENNPTERGRLTESNFAGSTLLANGSQRSLGSAFNPARPQDLVAHVGTADGLLNVATVVYGEIVDPSGDFNSDGVVDVQDMDLLGAEIASGANVVAFDLNGDSLVDITDRDLFLAGDLITSGNKLLGDADFDGEVQFPDFVILANNFAGSGVWSQGDFDVDGEVQFPDFVILANNFGLSAGAAAAVPEPSTTALVLAGAAALILSRGGRCQRPKGVPFRD